MSSYYVFVPVVSEHYITKVKTIYPEIESREQELKNKLAHLAGYRQTHYILYGRQYGGYRDPRYYKYLSAKFNEREQYRELREDGAISHYPR
jgi:phage portal protein BeeE